MAPTRNQQSTKRQLTADAITASLEGRWEDALSLNDQIITRFPKETEALNRKGRALIELRLLNAARDAYSEALKTDPADMIARRNLQRLGLLYNRSEGTLEGADTAHSTIPHSTVFIEELGKTWVDDLANPADLATLSEVSPGEKLQFTVGDGKVSVLSGDGIRLGELDARIAERVEPLLKGGNTYEMYALGVSSQSLRFIIREVVKDPSQAAKISFPAPVRGTQALMRERELLFRRDEADFAFGEEDDDDAEDETADSDAEAETEDPESVDSEATAYVGAAISADDDNDEDAM
ncbi:MAG: hypothetical protein H0W23_09645 [Chloroflexia bacterium]|nr:hypothetical protein [Chloroflexia bacterium]